MIEEIKKKSNRGFASMSPEKRIEIARSGGKKAQSKYGKGHRFTKDERIAGGKKRWENFK